MKKILLFLIPNFLIINAIAQGLTVEKIMQDQSKWIGTAPSNPFWSGGFENDIFFVES